MSRVEMSSDEARRTALAAQGFARPRPSGRVDARQLRRVVEKLGVLQVDSVNVLCRAHYLPLFSRLGSYPREVLDRMAWGGARHRQLFEYFGHRASLLPLSLYPLMRWRMEAGRRQRFDWELKDYKERLDPAGLEAPWAAIEGMLRLTKERPGLLDEVLAMVAEHGPINAGAVTADRGDGPADEGGRMWNWRDGKIALEWLFYCGRVSVATRRNFERLYDLTERVIPATALENVPAQDDAQRDLMRIAARAQGIATERELRQYFHLSPAHGRARIAELVESGELTKVVADGKKQYLWHQAESPARIYAAALLSPFDSLIWDRDRMLRLFGMHYRIGIYTPAARAAHGVLRAAVPAR
jgi:uncharacterized protein YcaQ